MVKNAWLKRYKDFNFEMYWRENSLLGSGRDVKCRNYDSILIMNTGNRVSALIIVNTRNRFEIRLGIYISCSKCCASVPIQVFKRRGNDCRTRSKTPGVSLILAEERLYRNRWTAFRELMFIPNQKTVSCVHNN